MAPRLRPGTPFRVRETSKGVEGRTASSHWHRVLEWWAPGHHHLDRDDSGEFRDNTGWKSSRGAGIRRARGFTREDQRADLRLGAHAQSLREEAYTSGGREERQMFYGGGEHMGAGVERKIRTASTGSSEGERVLRSYAVTYRTATGETRTTRATGYTPGGARSKVSARPGVASVTAIRRALL